MNAAAFMARKLGATFACIDCPDGRSKLAEFRRKSTEECKSAFMRLTADAMGDSLAVGFRLWEESGRGSDLLQAAVELAKAECVMPLWQPSIVTAYPKERREANAQRELIELLKAA
jgi:hypothetical protein